MSREIKFRAWVTGSEMMVDWDTIYHNDREGLATLMDYITAPDCVAMQYTGLKDKNGKEIYEGDILRLEDGDVSHHIIYWEYKEARWFDERLEDGDSQTAYDSFDFVTDCKVIGNIYSNPELKP